jgi:predicted transcriptional regulator
MKTNKNSKTFFLKVMGANPINRVLDFMIENERESWAITEISKQANVGYSTLKILLPKMEKNNLLKITKQVGKLKLYTIHKENPIVAKIYELHNQIILQQRKLI